MNLETSVASSRVSDATTHEKKHRGRKRDMFSGVSIAVATLVLMFVGSAILAIVVGGISHFGEAITSPEVLFSVRMSVVTSSISTVLCLLLALPTAYALSRTNMPCKRIAEVVMELTLSLPYILLGFALLLIFSSPFGKALKEVGLAVVFEPTGIVFAQLIVNLPFAIRMVRTAFSDVSPRMEFVAKTLGATPGDVFRTVILPLCRNSIISTFVLTWARGMGEFGATLMLVGVTRMKTETLPGSIYLSISTGNTDTAMATAMIMLLLSAATLVVANVLNRPVGASRVGPSGRIARGKPWRRENSSASILTTAVNPVRQVDSARITDSAHVDDPACASGGDSTSFDLASRIDCSEDSAGKDVARGR